MRHESFVTRSKFLITRERAKPRFRAARCQSRRVLGVSRVLRSHRVVWSLASSRRLSSRVVCRVDVRRPAARCQSRRVRSRVRVSCVSACVVPLLGVSRVVCGVLPPRAVRRSVPFSFSDSMDDVFFRPVLTRRVFFLF